jgi:hypothetical protein
MRISKKEGSQIIKLDANFKEGRLSNYKIRCEFQRREALKL